MLSHHIPNRNAHKMRVKEGIGTTEETLMKQGQYPTLPDSMKNDFQNARKRNLHSWAEWRTLVNDRLVDAMMTGQPLPEEMVPLETYICGNRPVRHATQNPKTLLTYSASEDTTTNLGRKHFISYGIPRVHLDPKKEGMSMLNHRLKESGLSLQDKDQLRPSRSSTTEYDHPDMYGRRARSPEPRRHHSMWNLSSAGQEQKVVDPDVTVVRTKSKKGRLPRTSVEKRQTRHGMEYY